MRNCFQVTSVRVGSDLIKVKTLVTSQVVTYHGKAGLILKSSLRSLRTKDDFPNGTLRAGFVMFEKAERAELTEL